MTEKDIIRVKGVEYEPCGPVHYYITLGSEAIRVRPKRKQTGWVCDHDDESGCSEPCYSMCCIKPTHCPHNEPGDYFPGNWQPFYGKVVE